MMVLMTDSVGFTITDEAAIPDEFCTVTVTMPAHTWLQTWILMCADVGITHVAAQIGPRAPSLSLIGEALQKPCGKCNGDKDWTGTGDDGIVCPECGGSGHQSVPGARLAERAFHVECK